MGRTERRRAASSGGRAVRRVRDDGSESALSEQNLPAFEVAVVVLQAPSNAFPDVVELMPEVNEEIRDVKVGEAIVVAA